MGAHALGAAAYAARAAGLAEPGRPEAVKDEIRWQPSTCQLRFAPPCGTSQESVRTRGPAWPGLLSSGQLGTIIRVLSRPPPRDRPWWLTRDSRTESADGVRATSSVVPVGGPEEGDPGAPRRLRRIRRPADPWPRRDRRPRSEPGGWLSRKGLCPVGSPMGQTWADPCRSAAKTKMSRRAQLPCGAPVRSWWLYERRSLR